MIDNSNKMKTNLQPEEVEKLKLLIKQIIWQYEEENSRASTFYNNDDLKKLHWLIEQEMNHKYEYNSGQRRRIIFAIKALAEKLVVSYSN